MTTDPIFENMSVFPLELEPEQVAALKFIKDNNVFPDAQTIKRHTNCSEAGLGVLISRDLIISALGGWGLTDAGMREAQA